MYTVFLLNNAAACILNCYRQERRLLEGGVYWREAFIFLVQQ